MTTQEQADTAAVLMRRMKAKQRYRRRRDSKIAVDYLGRVFEYCYRNMETGQPDWFQFQVVRYNPDNHTITLKSMDDRGTNVWDTDSFWLLLRSGDLTPV